MPFKNNSTYPEIKKNNSFSQYDFLPVGIYVFQDDRFVYVNEEFCNVTGHSEGDLLAIDPFSIVEERDANRIKKINKSIFNGLTTELPIETFNVKTKEGSLKYLEARAKPVEFNNAPALLVAVSDITEKKISEKMPTPKERRHKKILDGQSELVCRFNPDGILTYVNKSYCEYFDKDPKDLIGNTFMPLIPEEDHQKILMNQESISTENPVVKYEHRVILPGNQIRWQEWTARAFFNDKGQILEFQAVGRDITERKKAEEKLKESEEKYYSLFNKMINAFALHEIILDEDGKPCDYRFIDVNPEFEAMTSLKRNQILGRTLLEVLPKSEHSWISTYGKVALEGKPIRFTEYAKEFDKYFDVLAFSNKKGFFATIFNDVTETVKAKNEKELLLENIDIQVWYLKDEETYVSANKARADFLGLNVNDLENKSLRDFESEDEARFCIAGNSSVFQEKKQIRTEEKLINYNGETRTVAITKTPKLDEHGNVEFVVCSGVDVTDRKEAEAKLKNLNETLTVLNKILRHDIANNLTVASLSLEMLEANDKPLKEKAQRSISKCTQLIEDIRDLEIAIDSGKDVEIHNLRDVLDSVIENYPEAIFTISGGCNVYVDDAIFSVFDNIVSNSIFHGKSDSIDISIKERDVYCEVKISDNGIGIPNEIKDKIFEEGESFGKNKGSGLGLYIVKKVIERYGGDITIEDSEQKGAAFTIKFKKS